jgi:transketolase
VRDGAVLHGLPVRIVGVGGGFAYGHAGPTHYALEDLAIARVQPGMTVVAPCDPAQTRAVVRSLGDVPGPVYLRVGKGGNPEIPGLGGRFAFGRPEVVREGRDALLLCCGAAAAEGVRAAAALDGEGVRVAVAALAHLPFRASAPLVELVRGFPAVVTAEDAFATGGLGSLVAETIAEHGLAARLRICGVTRPFSGASGSEAWMRAGNGLDAASLATAVRSLVRSSQGHGA